MTAPFTPNDPRTRTGKMNQLRDCKPTKLTQLLDMQEVAYRDIMAAETDPHQKAALIRAWDVLEERIRILRGKTKAGSRNISVREVGEGAGKKLPVSRTTADYLAQAKAAMATEDARAPEPTDPS